MIKLNSLNPQQQQGVTAFRGPVLILAGAGTGKTQVLTSRIAFMIEQGVAPEEIMAMTFTNKAASEMRERIMLLCGKTRGKKVNIGTFHSACIKILRQHVQAVELKPRFHILDTQDQLDFVRKALAELQWDALYDPKILLSKISSAKNKLIMPEDLEAKDPKIFPDLLSFMRVYRTYERFLRINNAIDFDDCIFKTYQLLKNNAEVRLAVEKQYRFLLVDEFQDTNFAQLQLIKLLAEKHRNICVVGDDDQSIYSWRGAMYETLEEFERIFSEAKVIKLEQNYRCTNNILNAANSVIRRNTRRKDKTLWSASQESAPITIAGCDTEAGEARYIAEQCMALLGKGAVPSDIGVIYRANGQAKHLEIAFREHHLSYKTFGGQSFFDKKEIKDFFCYLRLILNPYDRIALWRIINTPVRGLGLKTIEKIESLSRELKLSPLEILKQKRIVLSKNVQNAVDEFTQNFNELHAMHADTPEKIFALGEEILRRFKLIDDLRNHIKDPKTRQFKIENLKSLPRMLLNSCKELEESEGRFHIDDFIDSIALN
nr:UvrD-helicase domain-containing protein [Oligoflexales bacterium]